MDFSNLLNNNTPFDENKLKMLETLVETLYKTTNNNDRHIANQFLNEFKQMETSWQHCDKILTISGHMLTKIYSVSILEDLVKTKFNLLSPDQKAIIRNFVIDFLIKTVQSNTSQNQVSDQTNTLISLLNNVIINIAISEWATTWQTFISEICSSGKSSQELCENNFKILIGLNEEIDQWKNSMTQNKSKILQELMQKDAHLIYEFCCFIFDNSLNVSKNLLKLAFRLYAYSVKYFPLDSIFNQNLLLKFLQDLSKVPAGRIDIMKCLGEIFAIEITIQNHGEENYYKFKNLIVQLFKSYITEMQQITKGQDLYVEYQKIDDSKKFNFQDFTLQFALSIISFFKANFGFIQEFDVVAGSFSSVNDFTLVYMDSISLGLTYLAQIQKISSDEITKTTCDFFLWFSFKLCFLIEKNADPDMMSGTPNNYSLEEYLAQTQRSHYFNKYYFPITEMVRGTLIERMIRPSEVKIDYDEETNEIIVESLTGTISVTLHETMRDCLIYLTHLNPYNTQQSMLQVLYSQINDNNWNVNTLNSVSWAIGCISGSLDVNEEKKFIVSVIKYLLNLCESKKGKVNKAAVASNIMYVVGQYYRFLNKHWKFLKTVVKKLFEFMHELHPGVQDFACETFLRISLKCGDQFVIVNEDETEPYINVLVRQILDNTKDLKTHQKLMFYEAIGNIIAFEPDDKKQIYLLEIMLVGTYNDWISCFNSTLADPNILMNPEVIKGIDGIIKLHEKVALSVKRNYFFYAEKFLTNMLETYAFFNKNINALYFSNRQNSEMSIIKLMKSLKKTILKYLITLVENIKDGNLLLNNLLPYFYTLIDQYKESHLDNRDSDVLKVFTETMEQLKNLNYQVVESIWTGLCLETLTMIQQDYSSFPEHRFNFFELVKSLIKNEFNAVFKIQDQSFNKNVINVIIWGFRHSQHNMAETGLETLQILLDVIFYFRV